jgi:hypothetical protein
MRPNGEETPPPEVGRAPGVQRRVPLVGVLEPLFVATRAVSKEDC